MSRDRNNPDRREGADEHARQNPSDFGDGRLPPGSPDDDLELWLSEQPAAHDDLADLRCLRELYQSVCPPEPEESIWTAALHRIRAAASSVQARRKASSQGFRLLLGLTAAAAILGVVLLGRSWWWATGPQLRPQAPEEPYPVAEAEDVIILRMDPRDAAALVVGEPPVTGELVFAQPEDVRVIHCERCPFSGKVAELKQGEVPMLVTSIARTDEASEK